MYVFHFLIEGADDAAAFRHGYEGELDVCCYLPLPVVREIKGLVCRGMEGVGDEKSKIPQCMLLLLRV